MQWPPHAAVRGCSPAATSARQLEMAAVLSDPNARLQMAARLLGVRRAPARAQRRGGLGTSQPSRALNRCLAPGRRSESDAAAILGGRGWGALMNDIF
jgi:hypothetical protein